MNIKDNMLVIRGIRYVYTEPKTETEGRCSDCDLRAECLRKEAKPCMLFGRYGYFIRVEMTLDELQVWMCSKRVTCILYRNNEATGRVFWIYRTSQCHEGNLRENKDCVYNIEIGEQFGMNPIYSFTSDECGRLVRGEEVRTETGEVFRLERKGGGEENE